MSRLFASILAAASIAVAPSCASAITFTKQWEQGSVSCATLSTPFNGGYVVLADKREEKETQYVSFKLNVRDYFALWPKDHIYVVLDSALQFQPNPQVMYGGRGIIIGQHFTCMGALFEEFSTAHVPAQCMQLELYPNRVLDITVHASENHVAAFIDGDAAFTFLPDKLRGKSPVSLYVIGATSDFTTPKPTIPGSFSVCGLKTGKFQ